MQANPKKKRKNKKKSNTYVEVILKDLSHKLVLSMVYCLDDETVILRKVKETSTLSRGSQLRENVLACQ